MKLFLLATDLWDGAFGTLVVVLVVYSVILYNIIKGAVADGTAKATKQLADQLKLQNQLQMMAMQKQGFTAAELQAQVETVFGVSGGVVK